MRRPFWCQIADKIRGIAFNELSGANIQRIPDLIEIERAVGALIP